MPGPAGFYKTGQRLGNGWMPLTLLARGPRLGEQERLTIRTATERDLPAIARIQSSAPEAAHWDPRDYLMYDCRVAVHLDAVAGFVVARAVAEAECEILNLAVAPDLRRRGIGRQLLSDILGRHPGGFYLEVRESNTPARKLYEHLGFQVVTKRLQYYSNPVESAIVMKLYSC